MGLMVKPDIILRSNRRTLSLTISKAGELIVRAPRKLSLDYIFEFIQQKEKWIKNKQNQITNINKLNGDLFSYNKFIFCGKLYKRVEVGKIKDIEIYENDIMFPANISEEKVVTLAIKWYKKTSKEIIENRLAYFCDLMQVNFETCSLINSKQKWGSCDMNGNIKFNLRIAMLPHKVIDYIIIHELAHLLEFNHSKNFYKIIESVMPDYPRWRTQLKQNNFLLQLLR